MSILSDKDTPKMLIINEEVTILEYGCKYFQEIRKMDKIRELKKGKILIQIYILIKRNPQGAWTCKWIQNITVHFKYNVCKLWFYKYI